MITNDDKINIVVQHIKNIEVNSYNLGLSVLEENAKARPDLDALDAIQAQIDDFAAQKTLLQAELASLQAE